MKANAQCSGCTINITGYDVTNYVLGPGSSLCISATGTVTGLITVQTGGTLCNQGKISSTNVLIAGGTFKNYGTIDTYSITISSAGTFTNYATALIDSLWITHANTTYVNNGTQTGTAFAVSNNGSAINNGTITVYDHADSTATVINNGTLNVTHDFAAAYNATYTNNGNINVANDFAASFSSTFVNNSYMNVMRDFYNSYSANFTTNCIISVGRDWYNSGTVYGPALTSCGGFSVTGASYNTAGGVLGSTGTHIDMCDAGHPVGGIDYNNGMIAGTTSYCTCANSCVMVSVGIEEIKSNGSIINIFPNPASNSLNIKLNNKENEALIIEVLDMMGRRVSVKTYQASIGENETELSVTDLAQGTYILSVTNSHKLQSKRLFSVAK